MELIKAAVVGYGNIGRFVIDALHAAPDFEIAGVVRRSAANPPAELEGIKVVTDIRELGKVDVAILCTPTREVEKYASEYLAMGINTVDSFDIHTLIPSLRQNLGKIARENGTVAASRPVGTREATQWCALFSKPPLPRASPIPTSAPA